MSVRSLKRAFTPPGRHVSVRPSDTFIVSYPRSGNTWLRFLITSLIFPNRELDFKLVHRTIPDVYQSSRMRLALLRGPRVLKSHEPYDRRYRRVVYLCRDPRDVAVSYRHYAIKMRQISSQTSEEQFVSQFVAGVVDGFGGWDSHVSRWLDARLGGPDFVFIRYEDLLQDPLPALKSVADLLGIVVSPRQLRRAFEASSFSQMREKEATATRELKVLRESRDTSSFVRRGSAGGWQDELRSAQVRKIENAWAGAMKRVGYALHVG